jgi:hypothetical protein
MHGIVIVVVLCCALLILSHTKYGTVVLGSRFVQVPRQVWDSVGIVSLLKMVFSYYQIIFLVKDVYDIPFPTLYLDFLHRYIAIFSIDWVQMGRLECLRSFNHYDQLLCFSVVMIMLEVAGLAKDFGSYAVSLCGRFTASEQPTVATQLPSRFAGPIASGDLVARHGAQEKLSRYASNSLIIAYFFYSPCLAKIFSTFNCRQIDGQRLLRAGYSVDCDTEKHSAMEAVAVVLIFLISIGVPVIYFCKLYARRGSLASEQHLRFFFHDYSPAFWWWECAEIVKRLLLVGVSVFFAQGGLMQIALSIIVVVTYLLLLLRFRPFQQQWHGVFAVVVNALLFFSLFAGMFVKLDAGYESKGIFEAGFSISFLTGVLISCAVAVAVIFIGSVLWQSSSRVRHIKKCFSQLERVFLPRQATSLKAQFGSGSQWLWSFVLRSEEAIDTLAQAQGTVKPPFLKGDRGLYLKSYKFCEDPLRMRSILNKYLEYEQKYGSSAGLFSLGDVNFPKGDNLDNIKFKRQVEHHWSSYPAYLSPAAKDTSSAGQPRVIVAFNVVDSIKVADSILKGNMHNLSTRDPGFYGKGIYLSADPEYW